MSIYNKNCLDVFPTISNDSVDLICTDPPYKTTPRGSSGSSGGMFLKPENKSGKVFQFNSIQVWDYAPEFYRVLKNGSHLYVMCNHTNLIEFLNVFTDCGFKFIKSLIWDKGNNIMGRFYMSCFEYILFFRKGEGKQINNCGTPDILSYPNIKTKIDGTNIHDTEKPVDLMKCLIENSTQQGDLVFDPFMGSGSTGVASLSCGRKFIGCEIDPQYFHICEQRINGEDLTLYKTEDESINKQKAVSLW